MAEHMNQEDRVRSEHIEKIDWVIEKRARIDSEGKVLIGGWLYVIAAVMISTFVSNAMLLFMEEEIFAFGLAATMEAVALVLFFTKKEAFRIYAIAARGVIIAAWLIATLLAGGATTLAILTPIVWSVWIAYFVKSKRVRYTFTEPLFKNHMIEDSKVGVVVFHAIVSVLYLGLMFLFVKAVYHGSEILVMEIISALFGGTLAFQVFLALLSIWRRIRRDAGITMFWQSYVLAFLLWIVSAWICFDLGSLWILLLGLVLMGLGVYPVALVLLMLNGIWDVFFMLLVAGALIFVVRMVSLIIIDSGEKY